MKKTSNYARMSGGSPRMQKNGSNEREFVVIAVPSVEKAREFMLASGFFEACPDSNNSVIAKETGIQVILIPISGSN